MGSCQSWMGGGYVQDFKDRHSMATRRRRRVMMMMMMKGEEEEEEWYGVEGGEGRGSEVGTVGAVRILICHGME